MKLKFRRGRRQRVSLIVKDHIIRFVEGRAGDLDSVSHFGERMIPSGVIHEGRMIDREAFRLILESIVKEYGLAKKEVQFIVPDSNVIVRKIPYPDHMKEEEIRSHLYLEIGSSIMLPFDDVTFDFDFYSQHADKKEILLIAAQEQLVNEYADLFEEVGLVPVAADISMLCLYRLYERFEKPSDNEHILMLQFDINAVNISIIHKGKPLFVQHMMLDLSLEEWQQKQDAHGYQQYYWSGDPELLEEQTSEIAGELERIKSFYQYSLQGGEQGVTKLLLSGDYPYLESVKKKFQDMLDLPVECMLNESFQTANGEVIPPQHFLTLGLALKEVTQ